MNDLAICDLKCAQIFDQIFGRVFDQGLGEENSNKYSVQYYPALTKKC